MSTLQKEVVDKIEMLSEDNILFILDMIDRYMKPEKHGADIPFANMQGEKQDTSSYMSELEELRMKIKPYFAEKLDYKRIWEEAIDEKYGSAN